HPLPQQWLHPAGPDWPLPPRPACGPFPALLPAGHWDSNPGSAWASATGWRLSPVLAALPPRLSPLGDSLNFIAYVNIRTQRNQFPEPRLNLSMKLLALCRYLRWPVLIGLLLGIAGLQWLQLQQPAPSSALSYTQAVQ